MVNSLWYDKLMTFSKLMAFCIHLTRWFATILSGTKITKIGQNNPFFFTVNSMNLHACAHKLSVAAADG